MFTEDVALGLMPYRSALAGQPEFSANFVGDADSVASARKICEQLCRHKRYDDTELVSDTIRSLGDELKWSGRALFELCKDKESGEIVPRRFANQRCFNIAYWYFQLVPKQEQETFNCPPIIVLKKSSVWRIEIPKALGGYRGYKRTLARVGKVDHIGPRFWRKALEENREMIRIDFSKYRVTANAYIRRITRRWGWNMRDWSHDFQNGYFAMFKHIQQTRAQAILRDHLKLELNTLFRRHNLEAQVDFRGLPTQQDCDETEKALFGGSISFSDASARLRTL